MMWKKTWKIWAVCMMLLLCISGVTVFASGSDDNSLSDLGIENATSISPDFEYSTTEYEVEVPEGTTELQLSPVTSDGAAACEVSGQTLTDGKTTVYITVTSESGMQATYTLNVQGVTGEEPVIVCPVDPYVEKDYFEALQRLEERAAQSAAHLVLMGMEPTYPSEKYGYIIPKTAENISPVEMFKEKPDKEQAAEYIRQGALWNGGVFAFRLNYVLQKAHELIEFTDYEDLLGKYETLQKISFDYAVVEKEPEIEVMRFAGTWKDLGTWNTLTEAMDSACVGEAVLNETCRNVHVVNELDMPVLCMGLQDIVVAASPEGILVSDKEQSSYIKSYVSSFTQQVMFAEKSWGSFRIMDVEKESLTIKVTLNPGHKMNYHSHEFRDEVWTVIYGEGRAVIDGEERRVKAGDVLRMPAGCRHMLLADTELQVIEVQLGKDISVQDKKKYPPLKPL
jgi:mannose-1-phosphate guanylyltransferase